MPELLTNLLNRLKDIFIAVVVAAIVAIILAGVVAFLTGVITQSSTPPYITQPQQVPVIWQVLSVAVLLGAFFGLLLLFIFRDRSDSYSKERKQLVGKWMVELDTWERDSDSGSGKSWKDTKISYPVQFSIDQTTKKLKVWFDQQNSKIFEPAEFAALVVGLDGTAVPDQYRLIFIAEPSQQLQGRFRPPSGLERNIKMPILFDLTGPASSQRSELKGSWLDIDNVIMRIIQQNGNEADKEMVRKRITEAKGNF
jgi:hypothetical protein